MLAYYEFRDGDGRWTDDLKTAQDWFPRHPTWRWFNSESYQRSMFVCASWVYGPIPLVATPDIWRDFSYSADWANPKQQQWYEKDEDNVLSDPDLGLHFTAEGRKCFARFDTNEHLARLAMKAKWCWNECDWQGVYHNNYPSWMSFPKDGPSRYIEGW